MSSSEKMIKLLLSVAVINEYKTAWNK